MRHSLTKVHHYCHHRLSADPETPKMAEPYFQSRIWCRFWISKAGFLFEFPTNYTSISLSFGMVTVQLWLGSKNWLKILFVFWPNVKCRGQICHISEWNLKNCSEARSNDTRMTKMRPASAEISACKIKKMSWGKTKPLLRGWITRPTV